jgi:outer membrane protein TolC
MEQVMSTIFSQASRFSTATVAATTAFALLAAGCATEQGKSIAETVPALDARIGTKDGTLDRSFESPWSEPSTAWDGTSPLTAEAAVRCALANNRQLRRTLVEVDRRRALMQDAQLPPNPTLNFAIGAPLSMGTVPIIAMLAQQIDWFWKRDALVGDADAQLRTLLFEAAATIVSTTVEVRAAYIDSAAALELAELAKRDALVAARVLRAEESGLAAGETRASVVNQARMNDAEAANRVMESHTALVAAKTRLLEAIGRGEHGLDWTTADITADSARAACGVATPPQPEDDAALHALVREKRLDLRAAAARVEGMEARVSLAMAGRWPTLLLGGGWERDMDGDEAAMVEIESTIPIFNQGRFRVDAATADLEIARIEEDRLWQRAVIDTRRALAGVAAAEHHVASLRDKTLANFDANQRIIADGVRAGERPAVELWKTEHQENHVRIQLARAQRDRALSALAFERALAGTRLPSMGLSGGGGGMGGAGSGGMGGASPAGAMPDFEFTALEIME